VRWLKRGAALDERQVDVVLAKAAPRVHAAAQITFLGRLIERQHDSLAVQERDLHETPIIGGPATAFEKRPPLVERQQRWLRTVVDRRSAAFPKTGRVQTGNVRVGIRHNIVRYNLEPSRATEMGCEALI